MDRASYHNRLNLISEYTEAKTGRVVPPERIREFPDHKIIGWWWDAKLYYRLRTYPSLDEIPDECKDGKPTYVRQGNRVDTYTWYEEFQKWEHSGDMYDEFFK